MANDEAVRMSARAASLRERLDGGTVDHVRFVGPPVEIGAWSPVELGAVWAALHHAARYDHNDTARRTLAQDLLAQAALANLAPVLEGEVFLAALEAARAHEWDYAVACLSCLQGDAPEGTAQQARRILGEPRRWSEQHYQAYLLACLAGGDALAQLDEAVRARHAVLPMPLTLLELALLPQLRRESVLALAGSPYSGHWSRDCIGEADPAQVLAGDAAYIDFSHAILEDAARHVAAIHDGSVPYASDGAFATGDSGVLARAARLAAYRDEAWFGPVIATLLPGVCVAPGTAKSAPSQSLAMALGHAVETIPTHESLLALRAALGQVRHAGIRKKLERNLKPAERALAERPGMALRLGLLGTAGKRRQAMLARCLEAGMAGEVRWSVEDWRALLQDSDDGKAVAKGLIWRGDDGVAFLQDGAGAVDCQGRSVAVPQLGRIGLWHPLHGTPEERAAWQALIAARKLRQPLRQAYREVYAPPPDGSAPFAGHVLSVRSLVGLARSEGWQVDREEGLSRQFGEVRASLRVEGALYPGAGGTCTSDALVFAQRQGRSWQALAPSALSCVAYSEACRAVDLLVSASAFALASDSEGDADGARMRRLDFLAGLELGQMARMRRQVLQQVFAHHVDEGRMTVDARHLRVGGHAVHLATARVTLDGADVADIGLAAPAKGNKLGAVPWLPYDEALLEKIAATAGVLLALHRVQPGC